jgi:hypothetical protein
MASADATTDIWQRMQALPRAYIYLLLAGVVVWQLLFPIRLPVKVSPSTQGVYDAIRAVPPGKLVVISTDWDASTMAETGPQTVALANALFMQKKKFVIMNLQPPAGIKLANDRVLAVARNYGAKYGEDWANLGYKYGYDNVLMQLARSVPDAIKKDFYGTPVSQLPIMRGVTTARDFGLVIEVTGLSGMTESWISLIHGPYNVPFAAAYTAVMAPGYYPFMQAGQISGMLVGAKGGAEMEAAINHPGQGQAIMSAQSWAHVLIMLLIVLSNAGYFLASRAGKVRS